MHGWKYQQCSCPLQRIIIRIILIHKLDTKHSNFDIHISLEIYDVSIRIYSLGCFGEVRMDVVGFKILIMGFSANW